MAKADDPPFGKNQPDLNVQAKWRITDRDIPAIREGALRWNARRGGTTKRQIATSPIVKFLTNKLKRTPDISGRAMVDALKAEAENGGDDGSITMSADGEAFVVINGDEVINRLAITSVPATISRLRKKI